MFNEEVFDKWERKGHIYLESVATSRTHNEEKRLGEFNIHSTD